MGDRLGAERSAQRKQSENISRKTGHVVDTVPPARRESHPWHVILDGQLRMFTQGNHFQCTPVSFRTACYRAAAKRGLDVQVCIRGVDVYVQRLFNVGSDKRRKRKGGLSSDEMLTIEKIKELERSQHVI